MRRFALLLPLVIASSAYACINDRDSDSIAIQAKKFPEPLRVITGRFERNPPLYYQMRIDRSLVQLKENPQQFGLYDDIGAAYDKLHRDDEALQIMARKRSLLPPLNYKKPGIKEAWYRFYANAGTFHVHHFLRAGAKKESLQEMKIAQAYIRRAMEIKPNAHFGREKYQLMTMNWIVSLIERPQAPIGSLGNWIAEQDHWQWDTENQEQNLPATEGLCGLIVLGAAWQSPDIFEALAATLETKDGITLRYLALLRCKELLQSGKRSLAPKYLNLNIVEEELKRSDFSSFTGIAVNDTNQKTLNELFPTLRNEADVWQGHRAAFMLTRLRQGHHPDTDPHFWEGWKPTAPPSVDVPWYNGRKHRYNKETSSLSKWLTLTLALTAGAFAACVLAQRAALKKRKLQF